MRYPEVSLTYVSAIPITNGLGEPASDGDAAWPRYVRTTDISSLRTLDPGKRVTLAPEVAAPAMLAKGDILMTAAGSLGTSYLFDDAEPACFAGYLVRFRPDPRRVDCRFAAYWTQSQHHLDQIATGAVRSTIDNYSAGKFRQTKIPLPPLEEQRRIADFLDDQVTRIDRILAAHVSQRTLIEEAFSSRVVELTTTGVEGKARAIPTGLPWIHLMNENWRLVPARVVLRLRRHLVGEMSSAFVLLSLTKQGVIRRDVDSNEGKFPASFDTYQEVLPSELVFCLFDVDETPRTVGLVRERGMLTGAYTRFEVDTSRALPEFLYWFYIGVDDHKAFRPLYTGMRKTVQTDRFLSAKVPLPELSVQHEVVRRLHEARDLTQEQLRAVGAAIDLLQEYKRSLITAAVTDELDVTTARRGVPA